MRGFSAVCVPKFVILVFILKWKYLGHVERSETLLANAGVAGIVIVRYVGPLRGPHYR